MTTPRHSSPWFALVIISVVTHDAWDRSADRRHRRRRQSDFKAAFLDAPGKLAGNQDLVAISAAFLARVKSGEVKLPFMLKGLDTVMTDIETRATAVSDALQTARKV